MFPVFGDSFKSNDKKHIYIFISAPPPFVTAATTWNVTDSLTMKPNTTVVKKPPMKPSQVFLGDS